MFYERFGSGAQHVIFVHGLRNSGEVWWPVRERLDGARVSAWFVDLSGCGRSPVPARSDQCTIEGYADDVWRLATELALDDVVLVGHSVGGAIVTQIALDHPEMVRGLVLVAPASFQGLDYVSDDQVEMLAHADDDVVEALTRMAFHRTPDDATFARVLAIVRSASSTHTEGIVRSMQTCRLIDRVGGLDVATLMVEGDHSLHVPLRNSLATYAAIPGCSLHVFHNVGHVPFIEAPDEFAALLAEFIETDLDFRAG